MLTKDLMEKVIAKNPGEKEFHQAVQSVAGGGTYVNFMGEEGEDRVRAAYRPEIYRRLVDLKNKYDPTNFFRMNQNVRPAAAIRQLPLPLLPRPVALPVPSAAIGMLRQGVRAESLTNLVPRFLQQIQVAHFLGYYFR